MNLDLLLVVSGSLLFVAFLFLGCALVPMHESKQQSLARRSPAVSRDLSSQETDLLEMRTKTRRTLRQLDGQLAQLHAMRQHLEAVEGLAFELS